MDELKVRGQSEEDRRQMVSILRRQAGLEEEAGGRGGERDDGTTHSSSGREEFGDDDHYDGDDVDGVVDGATAMTIERLQQLALKPDVSLEDLSEEERERFLRSALGGHLSAHIAVWRPWWVVVPGGAAAAAVSPSGVGDGGGNAAAAGRLGNDGSDQAGTAFGVTTSSATDSAAAVDGSNAARHRFHISGFPLATVAMDKLCPLRTSFPLQLRYNLVDVLCSFAFTLRLYNGDMDTLDPVGAALSLVRHSGTFADDARFSTCADAADAFTVRLRGGAANVSREQQELQLLSVLEDVALLLGSPERITRATWEFAAYLHRAAHLVDAWLRQLAASKKNKKKTQKKVKQAEETNLPPPSNSATGAAAAATTATAPSTAIHTEENSRAAVGLGQVVVQQEPEPEAAVAAYVHAWTQHLAAADVGGGGVDVGGGGGAGPASASELRKSRRLLSRLRRKALFYAAWARTVLAPGQLRGLREKFHEHLDAVREAARASGRNAAPAMGEAPPAVLLSMAGKSGARGRRGRPVRPKNFAINPLGPLVSE